MTTASYHCFLYRTRPTRISSYRTHSQICTVLTKLTAIFHVNSDEPVFIFDFHSPFVPNPEMFSGCDREQSVQVQARMVDQ